MIEVAKLKKSRALYISIVVASIILLAIYQVVELYLLNGMSSEEVFYTLYWDNSLLKNIILNSIFPIEFSLYYIDWLLYLIEREAVNEYLVHFYSNYGSGLLVIVLQSLAALKRIKDLNLNRYLTIITLMPGLRIIFLILLGSVKTKSDLKGILSKLSDSFGKVILDKRTTADVHDTEDGFIKTSLYFLSSRRESGLLKGWVVPILGLFGIVCIGMLAGWNGDEYSGKVRNAEELGECYVKAYAATEEYRERMNLPPYYDDAEQERRMINIDAEWQISLIEFGKNMGKTIRQLVEEHGPQSVTYDGGEFVAACDVAYITTEKVVWPDL